MRGTKADGSNHDWTPGSEGGTHILNGTCAVNESGEGKIVIGQIHAKTSPAVPAIILYYDNRNDPMNNPNRPSIKVSVYDSPSGDDKNGDGNPDQHHTFLTGASLNTQIDYQLKIDNTPTPVTLHVRVIYNGQTYTWDLRMSDLDAAWATTELYFKAGCYYNFTTSGVDAKVTFSSLSVSP